MVMLQGTYNKHEGYALQEVNGYRGKGTVGVLYNPSIVKHDVIVNKMLL